MKTANPTAQSIMALALLAGLAPAQDLRRAVAEADLVVVATDVSVRPIGKELIAHRLRVEQTLHGAATTPTEVTVLEHKRLSEHQRPLPARSRLYCLHDFSDQATALGLPGRLAPYYKMSGFRGSNPPASDEAKELARLVLDSEAGAAPPQIATRALQLVFDGPASLRNEAVALLTERSTLQTALTPLERSQLLQRAVGETDDVPFKIALASLCAEMRMPGLVDALCISVDAVDDPRFAQALGRIAKVLHGEDAVAVLRPHILRTQRAETRGRMLLAMGATSTQSALQALLRMQQAGGRDAAAVDAALRAHGSRRALEATAKRR